MNTITRWIKEILGFIIRFSGIPFLIREFVCRNKVTIIVYHDPKPEVFRKHLEYISKRYNIIPIGRLVEAISIGNLTNIPRKSLVITIDDGRKGNYELLKVVKDYNIRPIIYLCSHIVNTNRHFWDRIGYPHFMRLKKISNAERLKLLFNEADYLPDKEYQDRQTLNISEIMEMMPYVDFGSHSKYHPVLTKCDRRECSEEIEDSKAYLEKLLNNPIEHFAYPHGSYDEHVVTDVKNNLYKSARTLDVGWNDRHSNAYKFKVMEVQDGASLNVLAAQIIGFFPLLRTVRFKFKKE